MPFDLDPELDGEHGESSVDGRSMRQGSVSTPAPVGGRGGGDYFFGDRTDAKMLFEEFEALGMTK